MVDNGVREIADAYFQIQKLRVSVGNRVVAMEKHRAISELNKEFLVSLHNRLLEMERDCVRYAKDYIASHPVWPWLKTVKGVGPVLAMSILSYIDIEKADTISALWRYAGLGVVDGKAEKPAKGEKLHYNKRLKTRVYLLGVSFLRTGGKFSEIYYREKERQQQLHPDLPPLRIHFRAVRKMMKVFLACLWLVWRQAKGLPIRSPYAIEYLGHTTVYDPWYFSEKAA